MSLKDDQTRANKARLFQRTMEDARKIAEANPNLDATVVAEEILAKVAGAKKVLDLKSSKKTILLVYWRGQIDSWRDPWTQEKEELSHATYTFARYWQEGIVPRREMIERLLALPHPIGWIQDGIQADEDSLKLEKKDPESAKEVEQLRKEIRGLEVIIEALKAAGATS